MSSSSWHPTARCDARRRGAWPTLAAWAASQGWIADTGAALFGHGCPADAGASQIRRAHLRAGFAVHLAHVNAVRQGLDRRWPGLAAIHLQEMTS